MYMYSTPYLNYLTSPFADFPLPLLRVQAPSVLLHTSIPSLPSPPSSTRREKLRMDRLARVVGNAGAAVFAAGIISEFCLYDVNAGSRAVIFDKFRGVLPATVSLLLYHIYYPT